MKTKKTKQKINNVATQHREQDLLCSFHIYKHRAEKISAKKGTGRMKIRSQTSAQSEHKN